VSDDPIIDTCFVICPYCGTSKRETMPRDACQMSYQCTGCGTILRSLPGQCCVFCSYGSRPCPPVQVERLGKGGAAGPGP
jgi:hypothetical protein